MLAAEIPLDLREYTVHDASHLDALWETADVIAGETISLSPAEAFVLGCAFLIHDLGMGLAAYPEGLQALKAEPTWPDMLASSIEQVTGQPPAPEALNNPPPDALKMATELALRELHAKQAESLASIEWNSSTGQHYRVIEDQGLREAFGPLIGRIAHSHWWDLSRLPEEFSTLGGAVDLPAGWTVDSLILACLLRLADAAHVDARRAPGFLMALRKPSGVSQQHWTFQNFLQRVQRLDDRLQYTSVHRFTYVEASAWWLCLDTLRMIDRELRSVDALLADMQRPRLAARSVFGVDDPARLAKAIPTEGWIPIDAHVVVGDVNGLVYKLGGAELYGDHPEVAVRELIANSADAIRARKILDPDGPGGYVLVRLDRRVDGNFLEVFDNGIGMSESVMTGPLLDFGRSFWGSALMRQEFPNLLASGYRSTGRYGIGFFSVFMLGDHVQVRSRRFDLGAADTHVLEFSEGLAHRPILRKALPTERLSVGGTLVRVRLKFDPASYRGLLGSAYGYTVTLADLVEWLAPASPIEIRVAEGEGSQLATVVNEDDWITIDPNLLFERLYHNPFGPTQAQRTEPFRLRFAERLKPVMDGDTVIGRMALMDPAEPYLPDLYGAVVVGGLRAGHIRGFAGIVSGEPSRAARDLAEPKVSTNEIKRWATEQIHNIDTAQFDSVGLRKIALGASAFGANLGTLPMAQVKGASLSTVDLVEWARPRDSLRLCIYSAIEGIEKDGSYTHIARRGQYDWIEVELADDVLLVSFEQLHAVDFDQGFRSLEWPALRCETTSTTNRSARYFWNWHGPTLVGSAVRCIAEAWDVDIDSVLDAGDFQAIELEGARVEEVIAKAGDGWEVRQEVVLHLRRL